MVGTNIILDILYIIHILYICDRLSVFRFGSVGPVFIVAIDNGNCIHYRLQL